MGIWSGITAVAGIIDKGLGLLKSRQEQLDRQEFKQDGARQQQNEDLTAENEELRKDAEVYMRPGGGAKATLERLRNRARERVRRTSDNQ